MPSIDEIRDSLPEFAKDLKLNFGSLGRITTLTPQQMWGTAIACAAATRDSGLLDAVIGGAREHMSDEAIDAALGAACIMAMNNVAYRARHFLEGAYDDLRLNLRMNIIGNPGVEKSDFELWAMAVSTINGCQACVQSHEHTVRAAGFDRPAVLDAIRIAATLQGVAQARMVAGVIAGKDA